MLPTLSVCHSERSEELFVAMRLRARIAPERKPMIDLPEEYKKFLASGLREGPLTLDPGWYQLWPLAEVAQLNMDYQIERWAPGFLAFGSSGGGEILVFDASHRIFIIPAIGMSPGLARLVANSWSEFENSIEK
jgi:hypothetical protein